MFGEWMCDYVRGCVQMYVGVYKCMRGYTNVCRGVQMYVGVYKCMLGCTNVCEGVQMYVGCIRYT